MISVLLSVSGPALADDAVEVVEVPEHSFVLAEPGGRIEVRARGVPAPVALVHAAACRVRFVPTANGVVHAVDPCPEALIPGVEKAAAAWRFTESGDATTIVMDVWYAFTPDGKVRTSLAPNRAVVTLHDLGVDAIPFGVLALRFPIHPDGTERSDDPPEGEPASCRTWLVTDDGGSVQSVEVDGCQESYAERVREALDSWQLVPARVGDWTTAVSAELGVDFEPAGDGAPPTVSFLRALPPDLGDRPMPVVAQTVEPPHPEGDPLLVVHHAGYLPVELYAIGRPEPIGADASCDVLVQVAPGYRAQVWPERCDEAAVAAVARAADGWALAAGVATAGERVARFRATWHFGPDHVELLVADADVPQKAALPEGVRTWTAAVPTLKIPPKLPKGSTVPDGGVACRIDATVAPNGHPKDLAPVVDEAACPGPFMDAAVRAVSHWRWTAAMSDGERVQSVQRVRVRFGG